MTVEREAGITEITEDFIDVTPASAEPLAWHAVELLPGKEKKEPFRRMWRLTAGHATGESRTAYTFDAEMAAALDRLRLEGRSFEFTTRTEQGLLVVDTLDPLPAV